MSTPVSDSTIQDNPEWFFEPTSQKRRAAYAYWWRFVLKRWPMYALGLLTVLLTNVMQVLSSRSLGWTLDFFTKDPIPAWLSVPTPQATFPRLIVFLLLIRVLVLFGRYGWR